MPTFAGVTFSLQWQDFDPVLKRKLAISIEHYPDTNTDEIQTGGVGEGRIVLRAIIASLADLATLQSAMRSGTVGTLSGVPEGDLSNMILVDITPSLSLDNRVFANLEFLETT